MNKICNMCNIEKSIELFYKDSNLKSGYRGRCKDCVNIKYNNSNKVYVNDDERICKACNINKSLNDFFICNKKTNRYFFICKICHGENRKNYVLNNKEQIKQKRKIYSNDEKNKERERERNKERYKNDTEYKIKCCLRTRFKQALRNNTKSSSALHILGCDIEYFKKWISYQFEDWMTWENHGLWELDHVKPCASFNLLLKEEQYTCFNWKNYRPIHKDINNSKNDKIDNELIIAHSIISNNYETLFNPSVKAGEASTTRGSNLSSNVQNPIVYDDEYGKTSTSALH